MSQKFNYNELMIISKYILPTDYHTFFKVFPNINLNYHSTFNYITINEDFINFQIIKKYKHLLNIFPNINTIVINITFNEFKYYHANILLTIINSYNLFSKFYPNKFIKINITNKLFTYLYENDENKIIKYLNKINKLIKTKHLNDDFKMYLYIDYLTKNINYDFIIFIKYINNYNDYDLSKLEDNHIFMIYNKYICNSNKCLIRNQNDLNKMYIHKYKNTIFKDLNGETIYIAQKPNIILYDYIFQIRYFPSFYKLMKVGIKIYKTNNLIKYTYEYKNKLNLNDNIGYLNEYLFGTCYRFNKDVAKITYNKHDEDILNHYVTIHTLNNMFDTQF